MQVIQHPREEEGAHGTSPDSGEPTYPLGIWS